MVAAPFAPAWRVIDNVTDPAPSLTVYVDGENITVPGPVRLTEARKLAVVSRVSLSARLSCATLASPIGAALKRTFGLEKYGMRTQLLHGVIAMTV